MREVIALAARSRRTARRSRDRSAVSRATEPAGGAVGGPGGDADRPALGAGGRAADESPRGRPGRRSRSASRAWIASSEA